LKKPIKRIECRIVDGSLHDGKAMMSSRVSLKLIYWYYYVRCDRNNLQLVNTTLQCCHLLSWNVLQLTTK